MSKKINDKLGDMDLDKDLDSFDFDFPDPDRPDDRKPVTKFVSGLKDGAGSAVRDPEVIKRAVKNTLPRGYGQILDEGDRAAVAVKGLYDESVKAVKPAITQGKRLATKLVPADSKLVPQALKDLVTKWRDEEKGAGNNQAADRESVLAANMADIFASQEQLAQGRFQQQVAEGKLQEGVKTVRHRDTVRILNSIAMSSERQERYTSNVTHRFHQRSLELQYRTVFALNDLLVESKRQSVETKELLNTVVKNTGLPDALKITSDEARREMTKRSLQQAVTNGMYGGRNASIEKTIASISKRLETSIKDAASGLMSGLSQAEMAADMAGGAGMDATTMAGSVVGQGVTDSVIGALSKKLGRKLAGSKLDGKLGISKFSSKLEGAVENAPRRLEEFRKDGKYAWGGGLKNRALEMLQGLMPSSAVDTKLEVGDVRNVNAPYYITRRTDRSLNEVIPGYLARLLREVRILRTGDEKTQMTVFDHNKGVFTKDAALTKAIKSQVIPRRNVVQTQDSLERILNMVDANGTLSEEGRAALKQRLLVNSADNNMASRERLGDASKYDAQGPAAEEAAAVMRQFLEGADDEKRLSFSQAHNQLSSNIADTRGTVQDWVNAGNMDQLKKLGLIGVDGKSIDLPRILRYYLERPEAERPGQGGNAGPDGFGGPSPGGPSGPDGGPGEFVGPHQNAAWYARHAFDSAVEGAKNLGTRIQQGAPGAMESAVEGAKSLRTLIQQETQSALVRAEEMKNQVQQGAQTQLGRAQNLGVLVQHNAPIALKNAKSTALTVVNKVQDAVADANQQAVALYQGGIPADLYVRGESTPRLIKALMDAGEYVDAKTGTAIVTLKDLKGDVKDSAGNLVLRAKELDTVMMYDQAREKMRLVSEQYPQLTNSVKQGSALLTSVGNRAKLATQDAIDATMTSAKAMLTNEPADVYMEGEQEPRITAVEMAAGKVFDGKTGDPITHQDQIKGEVKNAMGQILVRLQDIPKLRFFNVRVAKYSPLWFAGKIAGNLWHYQTKVAPGMAWRNLKRLASFYSTMGGAALRAGKWMLGFRVNNFPQDVYTRGSLRPVLYGEVMKQGGYRSVRTNEVVDTPAKIDGAVYDADRQIVLTEEQYRDGLFNVDGRKVSTTLVGRLIKAVVGFPLKVAGTAAKLVGKGAWAGVKGVADAASFAGKTALSGLGAGARGLGYAMGMRYEGNDDERKELARKRKAEATNPGQTDEALANRKLRNVNLDAIDDKVEDGKFDQTRKKFGLGRQDTLLVQIAGYLRSMRDGAQADAKEKKKGAPRAGSAEEKLKHQRGKTSSTAGKAGLAGKAAAAAQQAGSEEGTTISDIGSAWDMLKDAVKGGKKGLGKLKGRGSKAMGLGGRLLGAAGLASGAASAASSLGGAGAAAAGTAAAAETAAVAAAATGAAATGAAAGGGALATLAAMAATAGTAIAGFLASPVVIGAAAAALVGYGAYRAVKYFRRGNLSKIGKLRMTQYGFHADDTAWAKKLVDVEQLLTPLVKVRAGGKAEIKEKDIRSTELMKALGLDVQDLNQRHQMLEWYAKRFKPVFLTYMTATQAMTGKLDLSAAEDLDKDQRKKFLDAVAFAEGPYDINTLPVWPAGSVQATTSVDVQAALIEAYKDAKLSTVQRVATAVTDAIIPSANAAPMPSKAPNVPQQPSKTAKNDVDKHDAEKLPSSGGAAAGTTVSTGTLPVAAGPMADGRNASSFIQLGGNTKLEGINEQFLQQLYGAIEEYGTRTNKKVPVNSGFRSFQDQVNMKRRFGSRAATPGSSLHEYGLAVDVDPKVLNEMERMGLLRKYGLTRPVGQEPWHLEPAGIQSNLALYKTDAAAAAEAIKNGLNKGGGGWGTIARAPKYSRNAEMALALIEGSSTTVAEQSAGPTPNLSPRISEVTRRSSVNGNAVTQPTMVAVEGGKKPSPVQAAAASAERQAGRGAFTKAGRTMIAANDQEFAGSSTGATGVKPNDPTFKVPDPKGDGIEGLRDTIVGAAKVVGVDENVLMQAIAMESDFKSGANASSSSASGLGQFTAKTWKETIGKYGAQYGYDSNTQPTDSKASALMTAHYLKDNMSKLSSSSGRETGAVEAYLAHFLGLSGATRFLNALNRNPETIASQLLPQAASANPDIFYKNGRPNTVAQVYNLLGQRIADKSKVYGLNDPKFTPADSTAVAAVAKTNGSFERKDAGYGVQASSSPYSKPSSTYSRTADSGRQAQPSVVRPPVYMPTASAGADRDRGAVQRSNSIYGPELLAKSEGLLAEQLAVQRQLLEVVKRIDSRQNDNAQTASADANAPAADDSSSQRNVQTEYSVPRVPVSMRRMA